MMCVQRAGALAAFEVAVGRRSRALAARHDVAVRAAAHRAARIAPFEARFEEDAVEAFGFGLALHRGRSRDHDRGHDGAAAFHDLRRPRRRSSMRALVHEPMKTRLTLMRRAACPA